MMKPHILYELLHETFGNQHWWPMDKTYHQLHHTDPRFEIIVGALLTQNTTWSNVEKALGNLKRDCVLGVENLATMNREELCLLIKPAGFFNQKAERLRHLSVYLSTTYQGNLDVFFARNLHKVRSELLSLPGIGPETADSILLYAGNFPIFVVDAYTKRLCVRLPLPTSPTYDDIQHYFEEQLQARYPTQQLSSIYSELHALIVTLAKQHCKKKPVCETCPLKTHCTFCPELRE